MSLNNITIESHWNEIDGLYKIQLNRPEVMNALNTQTLCEIVNTLEDNKKNIKCAIITGNKKAFSAGADIKQLSQSHTIEHYNDERETLWKKFRLFQFPIIAGVSGFCLGGGHELAMACDFIIATDNSIFGQPEINLGIMPGAGGTQRLTRTIGKNKAMYYCLSGKTLSAKEALDLGMIAELVPNNTLEQQLKIIGKKISSNSPIANRLIKESINNSLETSLTQGLDFERRQFYMSFATSDAKEGMNSFIEKRKPNYEGQ